MISGIDPSGARFLTDLAHVQRRSEKAQQQLSSGLRVQNALDDADAISSLLQARENLKRITQIDQNLGRIKTEVDTAEEALQGAVKLLERVRVLGAKGISETQTAETRHSVAGEVEAILRQLVSVSNTPVEGRYIFSGDSDQTLPYQLDLTQPAGVSAYGGSVATREAMHPTGISFPISHTAQEIFDSTDPAKNVFGATNALRLALEADDTDAIGVALANVESSLNHLNGQLAFYGTTQNQVQEASDIGAKMELRLRAQISDVQDADVAEAIVEFQQSQFHLETAMQVHGQVPRKSLFDFLF
jgi:flagellar hook-associated protein 3 FlgL